MEIKTKLSEEEMGRLALKMMVHKMAKECEIPSHDELKRGIPETAKKIGEKPEVLEQFARELTARVIGRRIGCQHVSLSDWV